MKTRYLALLIVGGLLITGCTTAKTPPKPPKHKKHRMSKKQMRKKLSTMRKKPRGVSLSRQKRAADKELDAMLKETQAYTKELEQKTAHLKRPKKPTVYKKVIKKPLIAKSEDTNTTQGASSEKSNILKYY